MIFFIVFFLNNIGHLSTLSDPISDIMMVINWSLGYDELESDPYGGQTCYIFLGAGRDLFCFLTGYLDGTFFFRSMDLCNASRSPSNTRVETNPFFGIHTLGNELKRVLAIRPFAILLDTTLIPHDPTSIVFGAITLDDPRIYAITAIYGAIFANINVTAL